MARISGEEIATGKPIEKRWLRLKHRTGRPSNFGKARLLVSVDFDPVGPVRLTECQDSAAKVLLGTATAACPVHLLLARYPASRRRARGLAHNQWGKKVRRAQEAGGKSAQEFDWENKHAYFQARRGNRVTLYADAHALPEPLPPIQLAQGRLWHGGSCWDDLFAAISAAKHFIYITGMQS